MKNCLILSFVCAAALLCGCRTEPNTENPLAAQPAQPMRTVTFTAESVVPQSRVAHDDADGTISVTWTADDAILVETTVEGVTTWSVLPLESGAGTSAGKFSGEIPAGASTANIYYPADLNAAAVDLGAQTQSVSGSLAHLAGRNVMTAANVDVSTGSELSFAFLHRGVIFTLPVLNGTDEPQRIVGITLTNRKMGALRSVFARSLKLDDGTLASAAAPSQTLFVGEGEVAAGASFRAYAMLFMEDYAALSEAGLGLDVFVHTEKGRYRTVKQAVPALRAGFRYTLNDIVLTDADFAPDIYLIGNAAYGRYSLDKKIPLVNNGDGTYGWSGPLLAGDFKFIDNIDAWGEQTFELYRGEEDAFVVNDLDEAAAKFSVAEEGVYTLGLDFRTMTCTVSSPSLFRFVCPVGDATEWGWDIGDQFFTDVQRIDGQIIAKGMLTLREGGLKFLREQDFGGATIHPAGGDATLASGDQDFEIRTGGDDTQWKVSAAEAGVYEVTVNLTTGRIAFRREGATVPGYGEGEF